MLEFAILGPLEVRMDGLLVPIGGVRQRALLAMLLLHANEIVSSDRLIEELWGGEPRADTAVLRVRISQLRKALDRNVGSSAIQTHAPGYVLPVERGQLDLSTFELLAAEGSAVLDDDPARAASAFREALALWRGPPLAEFAYEVFAQAAIGRLEEMRLATLEKRIDAELALGLGRDATGELRALVAEHPLREHFSGQLMLALYHAGRQAEALDVFQQKRRLLVDTLGIEPGPALHELQRAILAQDTRLERSAFLTAAHRPERRAAAALVKGSDQSESRKIVTFLVCDVVETPRNGVPSDPELTRRVRERYIEMSTDVLSRHSGTVERFIGDGVMAVFGVPVAHEDDALRAVRAAIGLRNELALLNCELDAEWNMSLSARLGIETGEVVTGDVAGRALVTGGAVQVAARLQQAAGAGEILLGDAAWSLVRGAVTAEFTSAPALSETGDEFGGWRLLAVDEGAPAIPRRFDTPFFGRTKELLRLRKAYERVARERAPCLFTVVGEAGIGKSRLAAEARLDLLAEARVLVGRCLPYGEGVTYVALREIVRQALGDSPTEAFPLLLADEPDGERIAATVSAMLGLVSASVALEEGFWGVRRLCEVLARRRPLVLVFEDVQWAETSMLDLIEYVAATAVDAPVLLLCLARHELLDLRPGWGRDKRHEATVELRPLTARESELLAIWLIRERCSADATREIVETARGNPLFVEQLIAMLADSGWTADPRRLPFTVEALLAARLELLGPAARLVLARASVLGDRFQRPTLARLVPADVRTALPGHLRALVRQDLLDATRSPGGDDGYRFRHLLVREAAYRRLPKEQRAELHEQYADELASGRASDGAGGHNELVGHHFERAHAYRLEVGREDDHARRLAKSATKHLVVAAAEALARTDFRAVDHLLRRATRLMTVDDPRRAAALYDRGTSLVTLGRAADADAILAETIEAARANNDPRSEWRARIDRAILESSEPATALNNLARARLAREGANVLRGLQDDRGLVRAWRLAGSVARDRGRAARMQEAGERMLRHARRSGVYREEAGALWLLGDAILIGPTPTPAGIERCELLLRRGRIELRVGDVGVLGTLGLLRAMQGDVDEGRRLIARGRELLERLDHKCPLLTTMCWRGDLELRARDWLAAADVLREASEVASAIGSNEAAADVSALHARAMMALGDLDEAERLMQVARDRASPASRPAQASWRSVSATILVARGEPDAAVEVASEAARLLRGTDLLTLRANVYVDLAAALHAHGDAREGVLIAKRAHGLYETKGDRIGAARVRDVLLSQRGLSSV